MVVNVEQARDYYADLELTPQATANDVKKQFKKLALKYHPDRNPGHEVEYNAKFQSIAAASEILSDPTLRAKYDVQRLRMSPPKAPPRPFAAAARPNVPPRSRTAMNFPPPPRPPPASTFNKPAQTSARPSTTRLRTDRPLRSGVGRADPEPDDARPRPNDLRAWDQLKHAPGHKRPTASRPHKPGTHHDPKSTTPPGTSKLAKDARAKAKNVWDDFRDTSMPHLFRTASQKPPNRKSAHASSTSDLSDEAHGRSAYAGTHRSEMPPPPPPRHPTAKRSDQPGLGHATSPRQSSFYPHSPIDGHHVRSSAANNRHSTSADFKDAYAYAQRHSAHDAFIGDSRARASSTGAAKYRGSRPVSLSSLSSDTTSSEEDDVEELVMGRKYAQPRPRTHHGYYPKTDDNTRPTTAGNSGKFSPYVKLHEARDEGEAPHAGLRSEPRRHSVTGQFAGQYEPPAQLRQSQRSGSHHNFQSLGTMTGSPSRSKPPLNRPRSLDSDEISLSRSSTFQSTSSAQLPHTRLDGKLHERSPLKMSSDSIDTQFSSSVAPPKFAAGPRSSPAPPSPAQFFPTPSTAYPTQKSPSVAAEDIPPPPKVGDKWPSEQWEKRLGAHTFEAIPSLPGSRASSRKRTGLSRPGSMTNLNRGIRPRAGVSPTSSDDPNIFLFDPMEPSSATTTTNNNSNTSAAPPLPAKVTVEAEDDNAMDIDTHTPPGKMPTLNEGVAASSSDFLPPSSPSPLSFPPMTSPPIIDSNNPPLSTTAQAHNINLATFRHVAPFTIHPSSDATSATTSPDATTTLPADLAASLPFTSTASSQPSQRLPHPTFDKIASLEPYPPCPRTPAEPRALTETSFARYIADMNVYMFNYNSFSSQMLLRFQRRQEEKREIGPSWVGLLGGDCARYLSILEEDRRARGYWDVACERHAEGMLVLKGVRERMLKARGLG